MRFKLILLSFEAWVCLYLGQHFLSPYFISADYFLSFTVSPHLIRRNMEVESASAEGVLESQAQNDTQTPDPSEPKGSDAWQ